VRLKLSTGQGPYFGQATWFARFHPEKLPSATERYVNEIVRVFGVLDEGLTRNGTGWLVGNKCTYADLSFVTWAIIGEGLLQELGRADELKETHPRYTTWLKSMKEREKVAKCLGLIAQGRAAHGLR
jgi:glutathione S-transferase